MMGKALLWLLVGLGAALLALAAGGQLLDIPASTGEARILRVNVLVGLLILSATIYFAAVRLVLRHTWPRGTVWVVLGVAVSLRALMLAAPPILSTDIYRYVWDGRVQAADINPYRYIPADPALATLRDTVIYPQINRADYARTIYPPVAQMVFAAVGRIWDSVMGMRLAMLGIEALGIVCLLRLLPLAGLPRERILIYVWNPLAVWSFANDGHVDAIAVGLLGLALLLRARHKDGWAGAALAGAVLAKFFPKVAVLDTGIDLDHWSVGRVIHRGRLARPSPRSLVRHLRNLASIGTSGREDPTCAYANDPPTSGSMRRWSGRPS